MAKMKNGLVEITFNTKGGREILLSPGMEQLLQQTGDRIANAATGNLTTDKSEGFAAKVEYSPISRKYANGGRLVCNVYAKDWEAVKDEAENQVLSREVHM